MINLTLHEQIFGRGHLKSDPAASSDSCVTIIDTGPDQLCKISSAIRSERQAKLHRGGNPVPMCAGFSRNGMNRISRRKRSALRISRRAMPKV